MGFEFKTPEERNPVKHPLEDRVAELEKEIALLNEFLEFIGKGHVFDYWRDNMSIPEEKKDDYADFEEL